MICLLVWYHFFFTFQSTTTVMLRWSINLTTLFLGRLPEQLTSTKCSSFRQYLTTATLCLESVVGGENGRRNYFLTNLHEQMLPDQRTEPATVCMPSAYGPATGPGSRAHWGASLNAHQGLTGLGPVGPHTFVDIHHEVISTYSSWNNFYSHSTPSADSRTADASFWRKYVHTCHISHCEIKSHRIWPIWKPIPIRFFKSHRIFRPSYNTFYEEININHTLLYFSQASYIQMKAFDYFWKHIYIGNCSSIFHFISKPLLSIDINSYERHLLRQGSEKLYFRPYYFLCFY